MISKLEAEKIIKYDLPLAAIKPNQYNLIFKPQFLEQFLYLLSYLSDN